MAYRVDVTERAARDLRRIYLFINAETAEQAREWFNGLETSILSLEQDPERGAQTPENAAIRHLLDGRKRSRYRILYEVDETNRIVTVLHIRHGARHTFLSNEPDDPAQALQ